MRTVSESQNKSILEYMQKNDFITPMEALKKFNCMRLAARIADLKAEGHKIITEFGYHKSTSGKPVRYARYFLLDDLEEEQKQVR